MEAPDLEAAREKLAEAYESGNAPPTGANLDPREIADPQAYWSEALARDRVMIRNGIPILLRYADAIELMRSPAIVQPQSGLLMGSPRPLLPLDLDGPLHHKYRRLLDPLFALKTIAPLESRVRELSRELIDEFRHAGEAELFEAYCEPLPTRIFVDMMGLPDSDRRRFIDWNHRTTGAEPDEPSVMLAGIREAGAEMAAYISEVLEERASRDAKGDDLLSQLLRAEVDGERLTHEQVCDIVYLLMIAGLDTVTSSLSLTFARLAARPDLRTQLVERPELTPNAVEEMMRYEAPVAFSTRLVTEDLEIAGLRLEAGSYVQVSWQACNLDPEQVDRPLEIDFERPTYRHTSFATGPHRCIGSHLARLEMRCGLEEFHARIPDYRIAEGREPDITYGGVRAATTLPIEFPRPA